MIGLGQCGHTKGGYYLREVGFIKELQVFPLHLQAKVVGRLVADVADCHFIDRIIINDIAWLYMALLALAHIHSSPDKQVEVEISFAVNHVATQLSIVTYTGF